MLSLMLEQKISSKSKRIEKKETNWGLMERIVDIIFNIGRQDLMLRRHNKNMNKGDVSHGNV